MTGMQVDSSVVVVLSFPDEHNSPFSWKVVCGKGNCMCGRSVSR